MRLCYTLQKHGCHKRKDSVKEFDQWTWWIALNKYSMAVLAREKLPEDCRVRWNM
jgi:hypothetical protein